jgi:hypothetical protein
LDPIDVRTDRFDASREVPAEDVGLRLGEPDEQANEPWVAAHDEVVAGAEAHLQA